MYRLRRILTLVLLPLFLAGCGSGGEDSEVELQVAVPLPFLLTEPCHEDYNG